VGSIEQHVLVPYTAENAVHMLRDKLMAVWAMFGRSPLCPTALLTVGGQGIGGTGQKTPLIGGAHEDTVALLYFSRCCRMPPCAMCRASRKAKLGMVMCLRMGAVRR